MLANHKQLLQRGVHTVVGKNIKSQAQYEVNLMTSLRHHQGYFLRIHKTPQRPQDRLYNTFFFKGCLVL